MTTAKKQVWLTRDRNFYRTLAALALPISLQNLITFAVGFADMIVDVYHLLHLLLRDLFCRMLYLLLYTNFENFQ